MYLVQEAKNLLLRSKPIEVNTVSCKINSRAMSAILEADAKAKANILKIKPWLRQQQVQMQEYE